MILCFWPSVQNIWVVYLSFPMPGVDEDATLSDRCSRSICELSVSAIPRETLCAASFALDIQLNLNLLFFSNQAHL